jgi:ATP-dependent helicase IRC3
VLRYSATESANSAEDAEREAKRLLRQAGIRGAKLAIENHSIQISFRVPETDNERYAHLKWHLSRVTGRTVAYTSPKGKRKFSSPRTLLRSMLPERCRIAALDADSAGETIVANIAGLTPDEIAEIESDFREECGMNLDLKGQMSLF